MQKSLSGVATVGATMFYLILAINCVAQEAKVSPDPDVIALLKRAEVATAKISDADGAASAYWSIGALLSEAKADADAVPVLAKAKQKAFEVGNRMRRWELVEIIAQEEARAGAVVDLDGYIAKAENDAQQSAVISSVAAGNFERGERDKARQLFERAWKKAQKISGPYKEVFFLSLADDASRSGDQETAKQFYSRFANYVKMLGGEAEFLGMRKLGEAQLEAKLSADALMTFQAAARLAMEGKTPEEAGEIAGLMAAAGFLKEAEKVIEQFIAMLDNWEPAEERPRLVALLADTLNREGVFPQRVLQLLELVAADDRAYLLPEVAMNLASAGDQASAAKLLPQISEAEDQISVMCAISDAWFKAKDRAKAEEWVGRALTTARSIKAEDIKREVLLEVAEHQVTIGLGEEAKKTWREVADAGEEFRRAIQEREFFQMVEAHQWDVATAALKEMADSPDVSVLRSGLATELAKEGQLERALSVARQLPDALPTRLEIIRLGYENYGSTLSREALVTVLDKHSDPEIVVSLIIGHVGGFRRTADSE